MNRSSQLPQIYWVVGSGTNVGKTTIATVLVKELNARGKRAIAFKPFAATRLQDAVDLLLSDLPVPRSRVFGGDAWKLAAASPLTGPDMVDLIVPVQVLSYPTWDKMLLTRTGSASLGNVEYFISTHSATLMERWDIRRIVDKAGLPIDQAEIRDDIDVEKIATIAPEKPGQAFDKLIEIGVDAVVCEGAARFLPFWRGGPPVNHLFHVSSGVVTLIPQVNLQMSDKKTGALPTMEDLRAALTEMNAPRSIAPFYLVEAAQREMAFQRMIAGLLDSARDRIALA